MKIKRTLYFNKGRKNTGKFTYATVADGDIINFFYKKQQQLDCQIVGISLYDFYKSSVVIKSNKKDFNLIVTDFVENFKDYITSISA